MAKQKVTEEVMTKNEYMQVIENAITDFTYSLAHARSPKQKRGDEKALIFWKSIKAHINSREVSNG